MNDFRFAGYRIVEFSAGVKYRLSEIAGILMPHEEDILDKWMSFQWDAWQPPGFSREDLRTVFGNMMNGMLRRLLAGEPELCISDLEEMGAELARKQFPFEALIISIHFFEESYMPRIVMGTHEQAQARLISMDEFLHAALAAIASSYFHAYREELLDQADIGRIVQEGFLADIPKRVADLEVAHIYTSARERARIGGDFLDYFCFQECAAFVIGDLSGHGLEAAADSVMLRSLYKGFVREKPDLADAMGRLNRLLVSELEPGQFATALAMSYNCSGGMNMVSAGHPYPVLCDSSGCRTLKTDGIALAIEPDFTYESTSIDLEPGAILIAYTDGLMETHRRGSDIFGEEGIIGAAWELRTAPTRNIAEHLIDESLRHANGKFEDDVAIIVIRRLDAQL